MSQRNEFNHRIGSVGAAIDEALCEGGTAKDIAAKVSVALTTEEKAVRVSSGRVTSHVRHLREDAAHKGKITIGKDEAGVLRITDIASQDEETAAPNEE